MRRRARRFDPLATPSGVRALCDRLRERLPDLIPKSDRKLCSLLNAVRHIERYPATETRVGRPSRWEREQLLEVARHLKAILERETGGRVSISSFVGLYLRVLHFPAELGAALEGREVNLQEAMLLARLSPERLEVTSAKAAAIRSEVLAAHLKSQGSQNGLRARVREVLGEADVVSAETLAAAVQKADELLEVDPEDKRHLFYEEMRNLFYAMREIEPEDVDDRALSAFSEAADRLSAVIYAIRQRRRQKEKGSRKFHL